MKEEIVYIYTKDTKEYIGTCIRFQDPLETEKAGIPVYMDPPNSTPIEPPKFDKGKIPVFNEGTNSWALVDDFRGLKVYDKKTKEEVLVTALGALPSNYVLEKPVSLQDLRDIKMEEVKRSLKEALSRKLKIKGLTVSVLDRPDVERNLALFDNYEENLVIIDGEWAFLKKEDVEEISRTLYERSTELFRRNAEFSKQIGLCKNKSQLNKLVLNFEIAQQEEK